MRISKLDKRKGVWGVLSFLMAAIFALVGLTGLFSVKNAENVTAAAEEDVIYIDTSVETIVFAQHPTVVFFGFKLTESDYDDFGLFESDFGGTPMYTPYEKYIALELDYWKKFPEMNSERVRFDQLYAYWNGSSVGPAKFAGTLAHRSTLKLLEYGFVINIPKGTTFPSLTYVKGGCTGTPVMYRTTESVSFYYNGTNFEVFPYEAATARIVAKAELELLDYSPYYEAECAMVEALVNETLKELNACFTQFSVEDVMKTFNERLDEIMTKDDYALLSQSKESAKNQLADFFNDFDSANYDDAEWQALQKIVSAYPGVIDGVKQLSDVELAVAGIKYAANNVLTKDEKADFAVYKTMAAARLASVCETVEYRAAESAERAALIENGQAAIANAASYAEVDAAEAEFSARIYALKRAADWEEVPPTDTGSDTTMESGCSGSLKETSILFGIIATMAVVAPMLIKNQKRGMKNED